MRAAVLVDDEKIEYQESFTNPTYGDNQVLIQVAWGGICGTDLHAYLGELKHRFQYPRIMCHEFSGVVEAVGRNVTGFKPGDRVVADPIIWCGKCPTCLSGQSNACSSLRLVGIEDNGAFADLVTIDENMVFKVPDEIGLREAATVELYAVGVHSTARLSIQPGDKVVVLGAGRLGLAVLELVKQSAAAWVASVDILDSRLKIAKQMGADHTINAQKNDPSETILKLTNGLGVDRVIECIGAAQPIPGQAPPPQQAVHITRCGGRIVAMGLGTEHIPVFWKDIASKELEVIGSRVTLGEFPRALEMMAQGRFNPDLLISKEFDLTETGEAFRLLEENPSEYIKILIKVNGNL